MQKIDETQTDSQLNRSRWKQNPDAVRRDILRVATQEFAAHGLSGTRMANIAAKTKTSKRMIYYYFGDKEGLYGQVLEALYAAVRQGEDQLDLAMLPPVEALQKLVVFTFDHHCQHPDFVRLVMIENIHHAKYLRTSEIIRQLNKSAIEKVQDICRRGQQDGVFRDDVDALKLHWHISSMAFFNVSNRPTFSEVFGDRLWISEEQENLRALVVDAVVGSVLKSNAKLPTAKKSK